MRQSHMDACRSVGRCKLLDVTKLGWSTSMRSTIPSAAAWLYRLEDETHWE